MNIERIKTLVLVRLVPLSTKAKFSKTKRPFSNKSLFIITSERMVKKSEAQYSSVAERVMKNHGWKKGTGRSNQRHSLQLLVVEFDTCLLWDLMWLPSNAQTAPHSPSFKGPRWRH